jgi:RNA polymerase sigma factor (sigma-70 family)
MSQLAADINRTSSHTSAAAEENVRLFERMVQGDASARNEFLTYNLPFVLRIAGKYVGRSGILEQDDLIAAGVEGLCDAADRIGRGKVTISDTINGYIYSCVDYAIKNARRDEGSPIRLTAHGQAQLVALKRAREQFETVHDRLPSYAELLADTGLTRAQVAHFDTVIAHVPAQLVGDVAMIGDGDSHIPSAVIQDDPTAGLAEQMWTDERLARVLPLLTPLQLRTVESYFGFNGDPMNASAIAVTEGVNPRTVSDRLDATLGKLRFLMREDIEVCPEGHIYLTTGKEHARRMDCDCPVGTPTNITWSHRRRQLDQELRALRALQPS